MHQRDFSGLQLVRVVHQVMGGKAVHHSRSGLLIAHARRYGNKMLFRDSEIFRVGA